MTDWRYKKGLTDIGNGANAYLQPDGSWGWSNAGLIVDGEETLLVDTLFDLKLTAEMLTEMRDAVPAAEQFDTLVNTHSNGDHTFGNQLVEGAEIIASAACLEEMEKGGGPAAFARIIREAPSMGEGGKLLFEAMGHANFDFENITYTLPTRTFNETLDFSVGDKQVKFVKVGPAHTAGDTLVYVPEDKTIFTGDILFSEGHPLIWAGPVANWVAACDLMLSWDLETVVPGHGPITDKSGIQRLKDYFLHIDREAKSRYEAGMSVEEATTDISLEEFHGWLDPVRIINNVQSLYGEYSGERAPYDRLKLWDMMARYKGKKAQV